MREIKFRVWFEPRRTWVTSSSVIAACDGKPFCHITQVDDDGKKIADHVGYFGPDAVVEQYTGLKDKSGVEIYEGDIMGPAEKDEYWVVEFVNGAFCLCRRSKDGMSLPLAEPMIDGNKLFWHNNEVLGNIHENPELLK